MSTGHFDRLNSLENYPKVFHVFNRCPIIIGCSSGFEIFLSFSTAKVRLGVGVFFCAISQNFVVICKINENVAEKYPLSNLSTTV